MYFKKEEKHKNKRKIDVSLIRKYIDKNNYIFDR